jgi:hypothetical protein
MKSLRQPRVTSMNKCATLLVLLAVLPTAASLDAQVPGSLFRPADSPLLRPVTPRFTLDRSPQQAPYQGPYWYNPDQWGTGFGFEGFYGKLDFDRNTRLEDQWLAGGLAGVHFGKTSALRGYYWQGYQKIDSAGTDEIEWGGVQSYGGEFQFDLGTAWFIRPSLLFGAGFLDFRDDYLDQDARPRDDTWMGIVGGGLAIDIGNVLRINGTVRDYLFKPPTYADEGAQEDNRKWKSNLLFSLGIGLRFGGKPTQPASYGAAGGAGGGAGGAVAAGTAAVIPIPVGGGEIRVTYAGDSALAASGLPRDSAGRAMYVGTAAREAIKNILTIELGYIDALYPETNMLGEQRKPLTGARLDTLSRRLPLQLAGGFDFLSRQELESMRTALRDELRRQGVGPEAEERIMKEANRELEARYAATVAYTQAMRAAQDSGKVKVAKARYIAGYTGVGFGAGTQFVLGARPSIGASLVENLVIAPDVSLGFGESTSALIGVDALYNFQTSGSLKPYLGLGFGVLVLSGPLGDREGSAIVLTPIAGASWETESARKLFGHRATGYFFEYQGVALDLHRIVAGVRWQF